MEFNALYPEFIVSNLDISLAFYCDVLGFVQEYDRPEERFAFLSYGGAQLMLLEDNSNAHSRTGALEYPRGQGINFSIQTSRMEAISKALNSAGHPLRIPVREQWHHVGQKFLGEKQLWVMDPDGYLLRFIEGLGSRSEQSEE